IHTEKSSPLERYIDFLPVEKIKPELFLGEGSTPLLKLNRLMDQFNLPEIYIKNEMLNPTGSFKDRGTVIAVHKAVSMGIKTIGTVSTGNMAVSTAAYGARAGIKTLVLVSEETSDEKLYSAAVHGAILIKVKGDYGELFYKSLETGRKNHIYFINSTDPFRIEGYKVTAFELFDQFKAKIPTHIFVPVSSGGHFIGLMKAFKELKKSHRIDQYPIFIGVQPEKASPIAEAFLKGESKYTRIKKAGSVAQSINNPAPPGGNLVLKMIREMKGQMIKVSDTEILRAQSLLASYEGLFCLPASAAALAGLFRLKREKKLDPQDQIVLIITGAGFKNIKILNHSKMKNFQTSLKKLDHTVSSIIK
ncbi:MAG TPA: threonine synthase, partial [Acidobacteriota bacterium]|nr:threonine synthase [Acidobacteriota bacterium]